MTHPCKLIFLERSWWPCGPHGHNTSLASWVGHILGSAANTKKNMRNPRKCGVCWSHEVMLFHLNEMWNYGMFHLFPRAKNNQNIPKFDFQTILWFAPACSYMFMTWPVQKESNVFGPNIFPPSHVDSLSRTLSGIPPSQMGHMRSGDLVLASWAISCWSPVENSPVMNHPQIITMFILLIYHEHITINHHNSDIVTIIEPISHDH